MVGRSLFDRAALYMHADYVHACPPHPPKTRRTGIGRRAPHMHTRPPIHPWETVHTQHPHRLLRTWCLVLWPRKHRVCLRRPPLPPHTHPSLPSRRHRHIARVMPPWRCRRVVHHHVHVLLTHPQLHNARGHAQRRQVGFCCPVATRSIDVEKVTVLQHRPPLPPWRVGVHVAHGHRLSSGNRSQCTNAQPALPVVGLHAVWLALVVEQGAPQVEGGCPVA